MHENQDAPPLLSLGGKLRLGTKADLLDCLGLEEVQSTSSPAIDAKLLDGAAIVQMLTPGTARTFQEYSDLVFLTYVSNQLATAKRVDTVWDVYIPDSLKGTTRQKRGKGIRRRVAPITHIPKNWNNFLRMDENNTELFKFLSQQAIHLPIDQGKVIYATDGGNVLTTEANTLLKNLSPCLHEEADTQLLLHAEDAVKKGHRKLCVLILWLMQLRCSTKSILMSCGWHLAQVQIFIASPSMKLLVEWTPGIVLFYQLFTHSQDVIPSRLGGKGKKAAWKIWASFSRCY